MPNPPYCSDVMYVVKSPTSCCSSLAAETRPVVPLLNGSFAVMFTVVAPLLSSLSLSVE